MRKEASSRSFLSDKGLTHSGAQRPEAHFADCPPDATGVETPLESAASEQPFPNLELQVEGSLSGLASLAWLQLHHLAAMRVGP